MLRMCVCCILDSSRITRSILRRWTPHFWAGSITAGIRARSGLNTHSKNLKIITTFTVRMLSSYKYYSNLIRCKLTCVIILQQQNCADECMLWILRVFILFCWWWTYFIVCGFCRNIRVVNVSFIFYEDFSCLWVACRTWVYTNLLVHYGHEWARECGSSKDMCKGYWLFDLFSVGTLTHVKMIETFIESAFATKCVWPAVADHFFCFGEDI
jgi:hypothetical protein